MRNKFLYFAAALLLASMSAQANASTYQLNFAGSGVSGALTLTYGAGTDSKYPQAIEITGISGTFTDTNIGITNANITGLESINHAAPDSTNLLAPNDFSKYPVAAGTMDGSLSYDNLLYFGGSPQTATDYPFHGGLFDIYGLLFDLNNGDVVNLWSNGIVPPDTLVDYGVAVATHAGARFAGPSRHRPLRHGHSPEAQDEVLISCFAQVNYGVGKFSRQLRNHLRLCGCRRKTLKTSSPPKSSGRNLTPQINHKISPNLDNPHPHFRVNLM